VNEYPFLAIAARFSGREEMVARVDVEVAEGTMKSSPPFLSKDLYDVELAGNDNLVAPAIKSSASARVPNFLYFALNHQLDLQIQRPADSRCEALDLCFAFGPCTINSRFPPRLDGVECCFRPAISSRSVCRTDHERTSLARLVDLVRFGKE